MYLTKNSFCLLQVRDVKMISDRNSRRSKGIAYVEFVEICSVPLAIGLTGQKVLGVPIIVQASQVGDIKHFIFAFSDTHLCSEFLLV